MDFEVYDMSQEWFSTASGCLKKLASLAPSRNPAEFASLASLDGKIARTRTVVIAGVNPRARQVWMNSHGHANKITQIKKNATSELTYWLAAHQMVQLRLLCDWKIVDEFVAAKSPAMKKLRISSWCGQTAQAQALYKAVGAPLPPRDFYMLIGTIRAIDALCIADPHRWYAHEYRNGWKTTQKV